MDASRYPYCWLLLAGAFLNFLFLLLPPAHAEEASLESYQGKFEARLNAIESERAGKEKAILDAYRKRLDAERQKYQSAGNLEKLQSVTKEIARIDDGKLTAAYMEENPAPLFQSFREILIESFRPIQAAENEQKSALYSGYIEALTNLQTELVKAGEVESAVEVKNEIGSANTALELLQEAKMENKAPQQFPRDLETALVIRYTFDEESPDAGIIPNLASSRWKGQADGAKETEDGKFGKGYAFNGVPERIKIPEDLPDMNRMTVAAWVKKDTVEDSAGIFSDWDGANGRDTFLSVVESSGFFVRADKDGSVLKGSLAFTEPWKEGWNHVAWVMGSQQSTLYLNGKVVGTIEQSGSNDGNHRAALGSANDGRGMVGFYGTLDEFHIWRVELSADEVRRLYEYAP